MVGNRSDDVIGALKALLLSILLVTALVALPRVAWGQAELERGLERLEDPPAPSLTLERRARTLARSWTRGPFLSVQVNVDGAGNNIVGDAANEPSIAVSPVDPSRIVVGWRQFDSVTSNFREAGFAYSADAGASWTFPGVLEDGVFRSDPVLAADADGNFYYYSLMTGAGGSGTDYRVALFKSLDGGVTWSPPVDAYGGDKQWMTIDRTDGAGRGHIYGAWNSTFSCCGVTDFARSINAGSSFQSPLALPAPKLKWGTLDVGPDGTLYVVGASTVPSDRRILVARSQDAQNPLVTPPTFATASIMIDGLVLGFFPPLNPVGLAGQVWVATDHSPGPLNGNVYVLATTATATGQPPDVFLARSADGGASWSELVRVNDDDIESGASQWFGTMSIAPNGRIDAIWNDTREDPANARSTVFHTYSLDGGHNWWPNRPVSPDFDSTVGFPNQEKIGDYYHMVSDDGGAGLAYSATFNGEQDVYFVRIPADCNGNGVEDDCDVSCGSPGGRCDVAGCGEQTDADGNDVPDTCQRAFVCYKTTLTAGSSGASKGLQVELDDNFNVATTYVVGKPRGLCAPASVNGTSVPDEATHLQGYQIKEAEGEVVHTPLLEVGLQDMLLGSAVDTKKVDRVLVAANVDASAQPAAPATHDLDRYECYKAKTTKGHRRVPLRPQSSFADGLEDRGYEIKKLSLLCSPADKDGVGVRNPFGYLACYKIKAAKGQPAHTRREGLYSTDELASLRQDTIKEDLLCTAALAGAVP